MWKFQIQMAKDGSFATARACFRGELGAEVSIGKKLIMDSTITEQIKLFKNEAIVALEAERAKTAAKLTLRQTLSNAFNS